MIDACFPLPIYHRDIPQFIFREIKEEILGKLEMIKSKPLDNPWGDTVQTTFKYDGTNDIEEFSLEKLEKEIYSNVKEFINSLNLDSMTKLTIKQSWFNFSHYGQFQFPHLHPSSEISGVIYYETGENCGSIQFYNPNPYAKLSNFPGNFVCQEQIVYEAREGRIILFPSWLSHSVLPNLSESERISISFNLG